MDASGWKRIVAIALLLLPLGTQAAFFSRDDGLLREVQSEVGYRTAGAAGKVNVSAYTYELVRRAFECEYRGKFAAKGKGEIDMYFVIRELEPRVAAAAAAVAP